MSSPRHHLNSNSTAQLSVRHCLPGRPASWRVVCEQSWSLPGGGCGWQQRGAGGGPATGCSDYSNRWRQWVHGQCSAIGL